MTDLTERLQQRPRPGAGRDAGWPTGSATRQVRPGLVLAIVLTGQLMAVIDNS